MTTIEFSSLSGYDLRPGSKAACFSPGVLKYINLKAGDLLCFRSRLSGQTATGLTTSVQYTYADDLEEHPATVGRNIDPARRTFKRLLAGMREEYGTKFSCLLTVICFEIVVVA